MWLVFLRLISNDSFCAHNWRNCLWPHWCWNFYINFSFFDICIIFRLCLRIFRFSNFLWLALHHKYRSSKTCHDHEKKKIELNATLCTVIPRAATVNGKLLEMWLVMTAFNNSWVSLIHIWACNKYLLPFSSNSTIDNDPRSCN